MNPRKSKEERRRSFNGPEGSSRDSRGSRDGLQPLSGFTLDPAAAERAAATQIGRRKTAMSRLALGGNLVSSLSDMSNELVHGLAPNATAKQKMQAVMINAKERGLTVPQIFRYFLGNDNMDSTAQDPNQLNDSELDFEIEPDQFRDALQRLGPQIFNVTEQAMQELINDFDTDGSGTISVFEFRDFCYRIPNLAWKAERLRYQREQEAKGVMVSASVSRGKSKSGGLGSSGAVAAAAGPASAEVEVVRLVNADLRELYAGSKIFWHTREKLELKFFESRPFATIIVMSYNETANRVCKPIFVSGVTCRKMASATLDATLATKFAQAQKDQGGKKLTAPQREEIRQRVLKESITNVLLLRLKLDKGESTLTPLKSDAADNVLGGPVPDGFPIADLPQFNTREVVNMTAWKGVNADIKKSMAEAKLVTTQAERAQRLLALSMQAFAGMRADFEAQAKLSEGKRKWIRAFKRYMIRQMVVRVRERLKTSPTYKALLEEQAMKRDVATKQALALKAANTPSFLKLNASASRGTRTRLQSSSAPERG